jgi:hypothetical protein
MSWHLSLAMIDALESSHSSPAPAGASSRPGCSGGEQFARLRSTRIAERSSFDGRRRVTSNRSPSGTTSELSTADSGVARWTSSLADSLVKDSLTQHTGVQLPKIYGRRCEGSSTKLDRPIYSQKTSKRNQLQRLQETSPPWAILVPPLCFPRRTWVRTTFGDDIGYLHTPTCMANFAAQSMQKWPSCRNFVRVFGKPTPLNYEWLMGWPIGWTALEPLATDRFRRWLEQHGAC